MKTFLGQLILRLQAEGMGEGKKILGVMNDIERKARTLGHAGTGSWGVGFQRHLDKLKTTKSEIAEVERSWLQLHESFRSRNLGKALRSAEVSHWRVNTLSHLAQQRAAMEDHFRKAEASAGAHGKRMAGVMKAAFVAGGFYTAAYGGGLAIRGGLTAGSEQTRTKYRMQLANIPEAEQKRMADQSRQLSSKYGSIDETAILELNRATYALFGGNGDRARKMMEPVIRAFIADVTAVGVDKAGENLSSFLKAMDNLNVNEGPTGGIDNIDSILEGWIKAKQIEGKDIDVGDLLGLAQRAKNSKYGLSDEFLGTLLPALGQDMGFDALGDALSGMYQNFVTPSSGGTQGQYVKRQKAMGLRDKNNSLIERDLFAANPYRWTLDVLKPLLEKSGVDTNSEAVKKLMSNSKAAGAVTGWMVAQEQIDKNIALYKTAQGTADVDNARFKDPFAASEALMASLRNLSAAVLPMETIAGGLNALADGINYLAASAKDNPVATALGIGGAAAGVVGGGKLIASKLTNAFGLRTAASELMVAAQLLKGAAGADAVGDIPGGKKGGGWWKTIAALGAGTLGGLFAGSLNAGQSGALMTDSERQRWRYTKSQIAGRLAGGHSAERERDRSAEGYIDPNQGIRDAMMGGVDFSGAVTEAKKAGQDMESALNVTARPNVDTSALQNLLALIGQAEAGLKRLGAAASAAADAQMRRNMTDYGVAP